MPDDWRHGVLFSPQSPWLLRHALSPDAIPGTSSCVQNAGHRRSTRSPIRSPRKEADRIRWVRNSPKPDCIRRVQTSDARTDARSSRKADRSATRVLTRLLTCATIQARAPTCVTRPSTVCERHLQGAGRLMARRGLSADSWRRFSNQVSGLALEEVGRRSWRDTPSHRRRYSTTRAVAARKPLAR